MVLIYFIFVCGVRDNVIFILVKNEELDKFNNKKLVNDDLIVFLLLSK